VAPDLAILEPAAGGRADMDLKYLRDSLCKVQPDASLRALLRLFLDFRKHGEAILSIAREALEAAENQQFLAAEFKMLVGCLKPHTFAVTGGFTTSVTTMVATLAKINEDAFAKANRNCPELCETFRSMAWLRSIELVMVASFLVVVYYEAFDANFAKLGPHCRWWLDIEEVRTQCEGHIRYAGPVWGAGEPGWAGLGEAGGDGEPALSIVPPKDCPLQVPVVPPRRGETALQCHRLRLRRSLALDVSDFRSCRAQGRHTNH